MKQSLRSPPEVRRIEVRVVMGKASVGNGSDSRPNNPRDNNYMVAGRLPAISPNLHRT